ncbi:fasciclin-like arabinogalactan protein 8 [Eucalyptus grandis]|uniref:fasciclin-like arabinogalactan protein 8 n=1 Tax=Eucalyptus grandis TaxID=71139 RepID=UPI00192ED45F|nr:fasciclin-like arabinogalactan protein 8 [Eucalyptus grandis]
MVAVKIWNATRVVGEASCYEGSGHGPAIPSSALIINTPILVSAILATPAPSASDTNVTALLEKAGCKTFAGLLVSSSVIKTHQLALDKGLTVFTPNVSSCRSVVPRGGGLHLDRVPKDKQRPISTLATNGVGKYDFTVKTAETSRSTPHGWPAWCSTPPLSRSSPSTASSSPAELFSKSPSPRLRRR